MLQLLGLEGERIEWHPATITLQTHQAVVRAPPCCFAPALISWGSLWLVLFAFGRGMELDFNQFSGTLSADIANFKALKSVASCSPQSFWEAVVIGTCCVRAQWVQSAGFQCQQLHGVDSGRDWATDEAAVSNFNALRVCVRVAPLLGAGTSRCTTIN